MQAGLAGLSESEYDAVRGGAVVFLGTLARHLDPENPKVIIVASGRKSVTDRSSQVPSARHTRTKGQLYSPAAGVI